MSPTAATDEGLPVERFAVGGIIESRFRLDERLGIGASGVVYKSRDLVLDRDVCIKVLNDTSGDEGDAERRFRREFEIARRVAGAGVCRVHGLRRARGHLYLVMDLVRGRPFRQVLREGGFSVGEALRVVRDAARIVGRVHRAGVVHRDLKPENLMLDDHGQVVVLDFGIATSRDLNPLTRQGFILGTVRFMAPERFLGHRGGPECDVFSLGVILYACLAGQMPWSGRDMLGILRSMRDTPPLAPASLNPEVPHDVHGVLSHALQPHPRDRFPDADAFAAALEDVIGVTPALPRLLPASTACFDDEPVVNAETTQVDAAPAADTLFDTRIEVRTEDLIALTSEVADGPTALRPLIVSRSDEVRTHRALKPNAIELAGLLPPAAPAAEAAVAEGYDPLGPTLVSPLYGSDTADMQDELTELVDRSHRQHARAPRVQESPGDHPTPPPSIPRWWYAAAVAPTVLALALVLSASAHIAAFRSVPASAPPPAEAVPAQPAPRALPAAPVVAAPAPAPPTVAASALPDETKVTAAPVVKGKRVIVKSGRSTARARYLAARASVLDALRARELRAADDAVVSRDLRRAAHYFKRGHVRTALDLLADARARVGALSVDEPFVARKLLRFNRRYDRVTNPQLRARLDPMVDAIAGGIAGGDIAGANRRLNQALVALETQRRDS
jgi:serine/threonine protein kinase